MGEVALKVIPAWAADHDPRRLAQLRREAERGARLVSPSLLPTYDFGEADGLVFLAMPLVVGCSLGAVLDHRREILSGSPPPPGSHRLSAAHETTYIRTVTGLIARVARAVAAAHAARVVHRDIKPMNILVSRDIELDQGGSVGKGAQAGPNAGASEDFWGLDESCVYLCDFGLARDLDVATPVQLRDGAGSPLYMAPERLRKQPADEVRCDVYALGVTLFEALTLAPPIEVPPELPRLMWAEYLATAVPQRAGELCPALPRDLEEVIHRAMSRNPEHRHPTAAHLADDLQAVLARGVHARDPGR
jgi:serine/threonine protein kinase